MPQTPSSRLGWPLLLIPLAATLLVGIGSLGERPPPLTHSAYIWQREWSTAGRDALLRNAPVITEWAVLAAEVEFRSHAAPRIVRVKLDYEALRAAGRPVSFALRVASYSGPFDRDPRAIAVLIQLARAVLTDARQQNLEPAALHLDFDVATRQLGGYRRWLTVLRAAIAPTPLLFTALPTWLESPAFAHLAQEAQGYVLQVHSWEAPRAPGQPFTLCDPGKARRAIRQAAQLGQPFWVALPTYGYRAWFDARHRLLGLSAEGVALTAATQTTVREVRADPVAMARLVRELRFHRPAALQGVIWYRLPLPGDRLSWSEQTWRTVMRGQPPVARTEWTLEKSASGLVGVALHAVGDDDSVLNTPLTLHWRPARLIAADGLAGFTVERLAPDAIRLQPPRQEVPRLAPGQRRIIGWLRFHQQPPEISVHVESSSPPSHAHPAERMGARRTAVRSQRLRSIPTQPHPD